MKVAIDPGHGMGNNEANVFDPGAIAKKDGQTFAEADIVLRYGHTLRGVFESNGIGVFMTRTSSADSASVKKRASRAVAAGCTHFISLHLNSFKKPQANGVEVQYRDDAKDKPLAGRLQKKLLQVTGFNDHGNDQRLDLAVLKFSAGPAVLIEIGFITNDADRTFILSSANRDAICKAIFEVVTA